MADIKMPEIVKRPQVMDFYNTEPIGETPKFEFMGTGFTQADQTFGGQAQSKQYINEYAESQVLTSYQPSIPFVADMIANDKVMADIFGIANEMKTGGDAIREYIRVWGFKPVAGETTKFEATKMLMTVQAESLNNDSGNLALSGSLQYFSGHEIGTFDITTKTFTPNTGSSPAPAPMSAPMKQDTK